MEDPSFRVPDDFPETLKSYETRIRALELAVEDLRAGRTATAQTAAQSQTTGNEAQPAAPGAKQPEPTNQAASGSDDSLFLPLVIGAIVWFFSGYFLVGVAVAIAFGVARNLLYSSSSTKKSRATEPLSDTAHGGAAEERTKTARIKSDLEQSIGRYWYLWTGVILLVVGLGYGLMLAYEHVGPLVKILSWFTGAAALVAGGEFAYRRMNFKPFGLALVAGGYAVGYFTVYAMQNIASVKLIDNVALDSCLLLAMAAGCMLHSLYRRSETVALLSALLAFVTLSLSAVTAFTVGASALMVIGLALVIVRMRWFLVYLVGVVGSYATFVLFTQPQITGSVVGAQGLLLSGAFLSAHWLAYNLVHFLVRQPEESDATRRFTVTASLLNAGAFITLNLLAMGTEFSAWRYLFLFFVAAAYGVFAYVARAKKLEFTTTLTTLICLAAATAAVPLWLSPNAVSVVWLLEVPVLVIAGLRFRMIELRAFAFAVALLSAARLISGDVFGVGFQLVTGLTALFAFVVSEIAYRVKAFEPAQHAIEKQFGRNFYLGAAAIVAWWMPLELAANSNQSYWWALSAAAFMAHAYAFKERIGELIAAVLLATGGVALILHWEVVGALGAAANVAIFFAASALYKWRSANAGEGQVLNINFYHAYSVVGAAIMWILTGLHVGNSAQTAVWLIAESAVVVAAGFWLKDTVIRQLGALGFLGAAASLALGYDAWTWGTTLPVVAGIYALSFAYRILTVANAVRPQGLLDSVVLGNREAELVQMGAAIVGTVLTTIACYNLLAWQWLAVAWSLEAIVLLTIGVKLNDKVFRYSAHAVFALMLGKLVLWDLRGAEQYVRVIIFIVAGIVSIGAAFIFARFEKKLNEEKDTATRQPDDK